MSGIKLIAEIGINHNGDIDIAKRLIDCAIVAGFDAVKFQKRTPELCVPEAMKNKKRMTPWGEITYLDYKEKIEFDKYDYQEIETYCNKKRILWFASAWDVPSAEMLTEFSDIVKIPSAKLTDDALLKYCNANFGTVMLSTGMSDQLEIDHAVDLIRPDVIFHTNSTYPCPVEDLNLKYIWYLQNKYNYKYKTGYSGHEEGLTTTYAAATMGVEFIERHITLDHDMWGSDHKSSVDPVGMIKLVRGVRAIEKAMGKVEPREITLSEQKKRVELK